MDFRDALRADADLRRRYEALKRDLSLAHSRVRAAYGEGKTGYIAAALAAGRA